MIHIIDYGLGNTKAIASVYKHMYIDACIVKSKEDKLNKLNAQFFIATMTKSFSSFSWGGSSFGIKIIENQSLNLPTKNNKPNYEIMETFISAIQKLVIKDVVLYVNKK